MKTEITKKNKHGIGCLLFAVCSAISLISAVAYLITGADGVFYNILAFLWLATIASGCVLAVFSRGPRWASFVYLPSVILYGLLHIVSSYLLMIAMGDERRRHGLRSAERTSHVPDLCIRLPFGHYGIYKALRKRRTLCSQLYSFLHE